MYDFSKVHRYDDRKGFKEAWNQWIEEEDIKPLINEEIKELHTQGYKGDILDKMFKSARYYFRKKSPVKPEPKQRRQYISVDSDLLETMDRHIIVNRECKPESAFILFCKENEDILRQSIGQFLIKGVNDTQLIQAKIKKTYKNRYFLLVKQSNK